MTTNTRVVLACLLALAAFSSSGCGDDDDGGTEVLRILVSNDDGIGAEGIDAIVEALAADPANEVVVSAPAINHSGSGDNTSCDDLTPTSTTTLSGYPATAVNGCPADSVNYALDELYPADQPPHIVVTGINEGQNVSRPIATQVSGTVGAALTAARRGVPAVAASQGLVSGDGELDYPSGVDAVLEWLEENRAQLLAPRVPPTDVVSINVPTCTSGSIRGTLDGLPLAEEFSSVLVQNCASTLTDPQDDVEAFLNGYITRTSVPLE